MFDHQPSDDPDTAAITTGVRSTATSTLGSLFNFLLLNLLLLLSAVPIITLPLGIVATIRTIDALRGGGNDRIISLFIANIRPPSALHSTAAAGAPLLATGLALLEVDYFATSETIVGHICLGLGIAALVITVCGLGYVFLFTARAPELSSVEIWSRSARLSLRNLLLTGPLFFVEIGSIAFLSFIDPALCLIGLPLLLLYLLRRTALFGLHHHTDRARQP